MLTTGGRGLWGNSPSNSPLASPVGSPVTPSGFARFFKEMKSSRDKDKGEQKIDRHWNRRSFLLFIIREKLST